nr:MAG: capsid protein [Protoparvovirus sp.]
MAEDFCITNYYCAYIENNPYTFPTTTTEVESVGEYKIFTGYHVLPTVLNRHFIKPKNWAELQIKSQAYRVCGYDFTLFNLVPMTTQLSFGSTQVWTAFNNCMYAVCYQDTLYETRYENWYSDGGKYNPVLGQTEGTYRDGSNTPKRYFFPTYYFTMTNYRIHSQYTMGDSVYPSKSTYPDQGRPTGQIWNPMERPEHIMEYRPGKNAVNFSWRVHPEDENKWINTDQVADWYPFTATGPYQGKNRPKTGTLTGSMDPDLLTSQHEYPATTPINDFTIPNHFNQPIVPTNTFWHEMKNSIAQPFNQNKVDLFYPGTELEQYLYGPTQCFTKIVPLFDESENLVKITAQTSCKATLHLQIKPRSSAYYGPTWGPFSWNNLYSMKADHNNLHPSLIRYRTAGRRRTWQNYIRFKDSSATETWQAAHAREDPYQYNGNQELQLNGAGSGIGGTRNIQSDTISDQPKDNIRITLTENQPRQFTTRIGNPLKILLPEDSPMN